MTNASGDNDGIGVGPTETANNSTTGSGASASSSSAPPPPPNSAGALSESLHGLGRTTESLLRTMRLDVVLLGSREEDMRSALSQLEGQWEMLEKMLREEEKKDDRREVEEKEKNEQPVVSTIDWGGCEEVEDNVDDEKNQKKTLSKSMCVSSTAAATSGTAEKAQGVSQSIVIPNRFLRRESSDLKNSNFSWGMGEGGDAELQETARRASLISSTGESLTNILSGMGIHGEGEREKNDQGQQQHQKNDMPILRRLFQPREKNVAGENKSGRWGRNDADSSNRSVTGSVNKDNVNDTDSNQRWSIFGSIRRESASVVGDGGSIASNNERPPPMLQLFGGRRKQFSNSTVTDEGSVSTAATRKSLFSGGERQHQQHQQHNETNNNSPPQNPFQRMFQRRPAKEGLDASSNTRGTLETAHESPSKASDASSSQPGTTVRSSNASSSAAHSSHNLNNNAEDVKIISSLQVKLRGCDSAASTLHQLLSCQTRNLYDLKYQHNTLKSSAAFATKSTSTELEKLRSQLHFAKVERRRKIRLLEDARQKQKKSVDQEERLKGELESIRTELFMMKMQMSKEEGEQRGGEGMSGINGINGDGTYRMSRDKVVIVGTSSDGSSHGDGGSNRDPTTQWRTGGYQESRASSGGGYQQQQAAQTPQWQMVPTIRPNATDAALPSRNRRQQQHQLR